MQDVESNQSDFNRGGNRHRGSLRGRYQAQDRSGKSLYSQTRQSSSEDTSTDKEKDTKQGIKEGTPELDKDLNKDKETVIIHGKGTVKSEDHILTNKSDHSLSPLECSSSSVKEESHTKIQQSSPRKVNMILCFNISSCIVLRNMWYLNYMYTVPVNIGRKSIL